MAQDYHIYIHDSNGASGNGSGNKTTPFSQKEESFPSKFSKAFSGAKDIGKNYGIDTSAASLKKVVPWIAVSTAVVKTVEGVLSTGFAHQEEYTGKYENNVNFQNFRAGVNFVFHPFKSFLAIAHRNAQIDKTNKQIEQQNRLIGNSILKDFNVGV